MDAEMDIKRKKLDARKKDDELEQIRMKRQRLTNAMNRGELDNRKIDEINKTSIRNRSPSPVRSKRGRNDEGREHRESVHPDEAYRQEKRTFRVDKRGVPQEDEDGKTYEEKRSGYGHERSNKESKQSNVLIKKSRKAVDREDKEVEGLKVTISRETRRSRDRYNENERQADSDSNGLENTLPDLRQRLVERKRRRKREREDTHSYLDEEKTEDNLNTVSVKKLRENRSGHINDDEDHRITDELLVDKNGKKILPKNLRIQATIRNDTHIKESKRSRERTNLHHDERTKSQSESRKRHEISTDRGEEMERAQKKRRVDESVARKEIGEEAEDELSEMRRHAIESMQRRRGDTSNAAKPEDIETNTRRSSQSRKREATMNDRERKNQSRSGKEEKGESKEVRDRRDSQIETLKQVIMEIQEGDSEIDISSETSEDRESDGAGYSDGEIKDVPDKSMTKEDSKAEDEESEISLSSTEDEDDYNNTRITVHTTNSKQKVQDGMNPSDAKEGKSVTNKKDPQFIVTLDGINSAYFKKEDKEVSKGGLKLKKTEPTSQTVYIKTNRPQSTLTTAETTSVVGQGKPTILLPTTKIKQELHQYAKEAVVTIKPHESYRQVRENKVFEKPKAMVAPLRNTISTPVVASTTKSPKQLSSTPPTKASSISSPSLSMENKDSINGQTKRKRISPPRLSPQRNSSPHSVLAGANRHLGRTSSDPISPTPGIM